MYKRLKDLREDNDKTQEQIAIILNTTRQQYGLYEKGIREIPIDKVIKLALFYKTSTDYLLGLTDETKPYPRKKWNLTYNKICVNIIIASKTNYAFEKMT